MGPEWHQQAAALYLRLDQDLDLALEAGQEMDGLPYAKREQLAYLTMKITNASLIRAFKEFRSKQSDLGYYLL